MDPNEFYEYEGRYYQSPTLTRDETLGFVDQLRDTVRQNNAEIASSTQALGTNVPSNLGGLTGANGYFAQRYQTAPIETQVNTLRATAQADALNKLMTNYKNQAANRYQQAYRNYQKRGGNPDNATDPVNDDPFQQDPLDGNSGYVARGAGSYNPNGTGSGLYYSVDGYGYVRDAAGNITQTDDPNYAKASDNKYYDISRISTPVWAEFLGPTLAGSGVTYEQWLRQWKANQAAAQKRASNTGGGNGGGGGF